MTLQDRIRRTLKNYPQTAAELSERFGVSEPVMRATLAKMIWPNGKQRPYGDIRCNKAGQYLPGDPTPLMEVPE